MAQSHSKFRVVVVDDSASMRNVLRELMRNEGYNVVDEMGSGAKLLESMEQAKPHIVLLDYNLPDIDGLTLLKQIHASHPRVSVVMVTGSDKRELEAEAAEAGAAGFLHKPFTQEQICNVLKHVAHAQQLLHEVEDKAKRSGNKPPRARAVIADDSQTLRQLLHAILVHAGVEVVGEASNGVQAVELAAKHQPDFMCLDFEMPEMNGLEALKMIHSQYPAIKVLMITSNAKRESVVLTAKYGATGYIIKPFHPDKVAEAITHLIEH